MTTTQNTLTQKLIAAGYEGSWKGGRFCFAGKTVEMRCKGKAIRGNAAWLAFDDPSTLEGVRVEVEAKKAFGRSILASNHADAALIAIEIVDPAEAARLRTEITEAREAEELIGDLV